MPPFAMKSKEKMHRPPVCRPFTRSKTHRGKSKGSSPVQRSA
jgi:hypothetical protein